MLNKTHIFRKTMMTVNIIDKQEIVVGIDIGGTNTALGIVDFKNNILCEHSFKTCPDKGADDYFGRLDAAIREVYIKFENKYVLSGIGMAAPAANYLKGTIESSANLKWENVDVIKIMKKHFDIPVAIMNDADAAAMGEHVFGVAKNMKNFIVLTLGTGLGSGIFVKGHLLHGENGLAGELGHIIIEQDGRECSCGRKGCLETYVSASGIKRTVSYLLSTSRLETGLKNISLNELTSKKVSELALNKDPVALQVFNYTGEILGKALSNIVTIFDPEAIILFGGLADADELLLKPTKFYFEENLLSFYKGKVKILKSGLQNGKAAVLGSCELVKEKIVNNIINV
jgi:glucokinase